MCTHLEGGYGADRKVHHATFDKYWWLKAKKQACHPFTLPPGILSNLGIDDSPLVSSRITVLSIPIANDQILCLVSLGRDIAGVLDEMHAVVVGGHHLSDISNAMQ